MARVNQLGTAADLLLSYRVFVQVEDGGGSRSDDVPQALQFGLLGGVSIGRVVGDVLGIEHKGATSPDAAP